MKPRQKNFAMAQRRRFLHLAAGAMLLGAAPQLQAALAAPERRLRFRHTHTGETLDAVYWVQGVYQPESLALIERLLRDHRNGAQHPIAPALLDLLHRVAAALGTDAAFQVISGYRSPATNAALAAHSRGVAVASLHTRGMAIDVRVPGRELSSLRAAGLALQGGGVGYYPGDDFVHLDVGRVRTW